MLRRTPLRRSRPKPWFRAEEDKVSAEMRRAVLARDKACVLWIMDHGHSCRDRFGVPHAPFDERRLTIEHVKDQIGMGVRAPSDMAHMVALCGGANVGVPSKAEREWMRDYLRRVEG